MTQIKNCVGVIRPGVKSKLESVSTLPFGSLRYVHCVLHCVIQTHRPTKCATAPAEWKNLGPVRTVLHYGPAEMCPGSGKDRYGPLCPVEVRRYCVYSECCHFAVVSFTEAVCTKLEFTRLSVCLWW